MNLEVLYIFLILANIVKAFSVPKMTQPINRGYYTVARRYEFYVLVART